jgi:hypothetical protein
MNRWGKIARDHWVQHRPIAYAEITDPDDHFTRLGEHIYDEVNALQMSLAGDDVVGEGFWGKVRRLETARTTAGEAVLRELLPLAETDVAEQRQHAQSRTSAGLAAEDEVGGPSAPR